LNAEIAEERGDRRETEKLSVLCVSAAFALKPFSRGALGAS
jgi:hypothetical protein